MPLSLNEEIQYLTERGLDPEQFSVDQFSLEIKPKQKAQPTISPTTASPVGVGGTIARTAALGVLPNAAAFGPALAAGAKVGAMTAPVLGPWSAIPAIGAGLVVGAGVGSVASAVQDAALNQFEGGRKFLDTTAKAAEEHPYAAVAGNVASTLPTMRPNLQMLKDAAHALTTEARGGAGLLNKLATSEAAQNVLISGGIGGAMSVGEDLQADKPVDVKKALLNTVLQGVVSDAHGGVLGSVPGIGPLLKSAAYKGQPHAVLNDAQLRSSVTETTTPGAVDPELAAKRQAKLEKMDVDRKVLEEANMFAEQQNIEIDKIETAQKLANLEKRRKALEATIAKPVEPDVMSVRTASPELGQWGTEKGLQKGVKETVITDTGTQTDKPYGSFVPEKIEASTFISRKGPKDTAEVTNLAEYSGEEAPFLAGSKDKPVTAASTIVHEPVHAEIYNILNSESTSQTKRGQELKAAVEADPRFKQWQEATNGKIVDNGWEEYLTRSVTRDFLADPKHSKRSWAEERKALSRLSSGKANADDAVRIAGMKFRYDSQLAAPRVTKAPVSSQATPSVTELYEQELSRASSSLESPLSAEEAAAYEWQAATQLKFDEIKARYGESKDGLKWQKDPAAIALFPAWAESVTKYPHAPPNWDRTFAGHIKGRIGGKPFIKSDTNIYLKDKDKWYSVTNFPRLDDGSPVGQHNFHRMISEQEPRLVKDYNPSLNAWLDRQADNLPNEAQAVNLLGDVKFSEPSADVTAVNTENELHPFEDPKRIKAFLDTQRSNVRAALPTNQYSENPREWQASKLLALMEESGMKVSKSYFSELQNKPENAGVSAYDLLRNFKSRKTKFKLNEDTRELEAQPKIGAASTAKTKDEFIQKHLLDNPEDSPAMAETSFTDFIEKAARKGLLKMPFDSQTRFLGSDGAGDPSASTIAARQPQAVRDMVTYVNESVTRSGIGDEGLEKEAIKAAQLFVKRRLDARQTESEGKKLYKNEVGTGAKKSRASLDAADVANEGGINEAVSEDASGSEGEELADKPRVSGAARERGAEVGALIAKASASLSTLEGKPLRDSVKIYRKELSKLMPEKRANVIIDALIDAPISEGELTKIKSGEIKLSEPSREMTVVETPEFKRWFGDSKVVDDAGKPLVVYHATDKDFTVYSKEKTGGVGFYFTTGKAVASDLAKYRPEGANIQPVYLSIKNPAPDSVWHEAYYNASGGNPRKMANEALEKLGYDGFFREDGAIIAFDPHQIKSATGNSGAFDPANPDIRRSEPSATSTPVTPYEPDNTKQGWLEKLAPQIDQVRKFSPQVADAMSNADRKREEYEGKFLWSALKKMQKAFPDATLEDNTAALDYARAQFRREPLPYVTAEQEAMAKLWNEEVARPIRVEQKEQGMPIETESGKRRDAKLSRWYAADMLSAEALDTFTKSTNTAEVERLKNMWANHIVDASQELAKPISFQDAKAEINGFVDALGRGSKDASEFGALRKAQGFGLPAALRERSLTRMMQRYSRRAARDMANFQFLEKDPVVGALLGMEDPNTGYRYPEPPTGRLTPHEEVSNALKFLNNSFQVAHNPRELGFIRLVNNMIMGPMSGVRDTATVAVNALPYVDSVDGALDIFRGLFRARSEAQASLEAGARTGTHRFDQFDTLDGVDMAANTFNKAAEFMRKYSGRDIIEQGNRIWVFAIGKQLAERAIRENNTRFLDKFGAIAKTTAKDGTVTWDTNKLAKAFVDRNQGTYGGRGLPASTVEGMAAPWFSLARWSIEKSNVIYQDVIKPAYIPDKDGKRNFGPLLTYALGAYLTGEAVEKLTEVLNNDKKMSIPKWEELDAADAGIDKKVARLINVMQLGSFGGIAGDLLKMTSDIAQGDKPRGFTVPAAELIGDGIVGSTVNFTRAVRDGSDPIDAAGILLQEFLKNQVQVARIANNWSDSDEAERKNRFRDLRVWKQMTGREVPSGFNETNPAVRPEERQLKRATTPEEVAELLPKILDGLVEKHKDNPWALKKAIDRLKSNSYQTFPSPQSDGPDAMAYYEYLVRSVGKEEAEARLEDYIQQSGFNRGKSRALGAKR